VETQDLHGHDHEYVARKIVVATGYYDRPNYMGIPGEDLPKVMHYYKDPHPYFDMDVLIIGARIPRRLRRWSCAARIARYDGASRAGDSPQREVLDQAGH